MNTPDPFRRAHPAKPPDENQLCLKMECHVSHLARALQPLLQLAGHCRTLRRDYFWNFAAAGPLNNHDAVHCEEWTRSQPCHRQRHYHSKWSESPRSRTLTAPDMHEQMCHCSLRLHFGISIVPCQLAAWSLDEWPCPNCGQFHCPFPSHLQ